MRGFFGPVLLFAVAAVLGGSFTGAGACVRSSDTGVAPHPGSLGLSHRWLSEIPTLYSEPENPVLQSVDLAGIVHSQYARVDAEQGDYDGHERRRFRFVGGRLSGCELPHRW